MKRYRIVKHTTEWDEPGEYGTTIHHRSTGYEVQKRFLGFLWWYNFLNIDGYTTGYFDTLHEAQAAINQAMSKTHKTIAEEYE